MRGQSYPFKNISGHTVPPFGVMRFISSTVEERKFVLQMGRPSTTFFPIWYVNGPTEVANNKHGNCYTLTDYHGLVNVSTDDELEVSSQTRVTWGPKKDSFSLHRMYLGFESLSSELAIDNVGGVSAGYFRQHPQYTAEVKVAGISDFSITYSCKVVYTDIDNDADQWPKEETGMSVNAMWHGMMKLETGDCIIGAASNIPGQVTYCGGNWLITNLGC